MDRPSTYLKPEALSRKPSQKSICAPSLAKRAGMISVGVPQSVGLASV